MIILSYYFIIFFNNIFLIKKYYYIFIFLIIIPDINLYRTLQYSDFNIWIEIAKSFAPNLLLK